MKLLNLFKRGVNLGALLKSIHTSTAYGNPFDDSLIEKQESGGLIRFELSCTSEQVKHLESLLVSFKVANEYRNLGIVDCIISLDEYNTKFQGKDFAKLELSARKLYEHYYKLDRKKQKVFSSMYHQTISVVYNYVSRGVFNITSEQMDICTEILDSILNLEYTDVIASSNALMEELLILRRLHQTHVKGNEDEQAWAANMVEKLKETED